eukprot:TRINITY_DN1818_c0_g1_i2.p2 TRINITY_DN1818_c0_g1~~TRINITY_DN1818_c0_g1_i2.p2  ORF type:complete len:177 (-),score=64.90 TRINITY_DN1818_c0_g1_i2:126-656(-)
METVMTIQVEALIAAGLSGEPMELLTQFATVCKEHETDPEVTALADKIKTEVEAAKQAKAAKAVASEPEPAAPETNAQAATLDKEKLLEVLPVILQRITSEETKAKLDAAGKDLGKIMETVMTIQAEALMAAGLSGEPMELLTQFATVCKEHETDPEVTALADKIKTEVEAAKQTK